MFQLTVPPAVVPALKLALPLTTLSSNQILISKALFDLLCNPMQLNLLLKIEIKHLWPLDR